MDVIIQLGVFVILLAIGLFAGRANERKHFRELAENEERLRDIEIRGGRVGADAGALQRGTLVIGSVVIAEDYFKRVAAGLKSLVGGNLRSYESLLERGRREAIVRMSTARGGAGGAIVFLSSRASDYASPGEHVWYAASKGGVDSLTRGLAREVGKEGIRVNAVSPGPVATEMLDPAKQERAAGLSPIGRIGTPEEIAAAVLFMASDAASFVTGANLAVSGGR